MIVYQTRFPLHPMVRLLGLLAVLGANQAIADELTPPANGWSTWQVTAVEDAPDWCCFYWYNDRATPRVCDLDSGHTNYGGSHEQAESPSQMRIYALLEDGKPRKIRTLAADCPVESDNEVTDLGNIANADSIDWLEEYISPHSRLSSHVLAAVAVHDGNRARRLLVDTARDDADTENRKDAVFWMGQVRAVDTADDIRDIMFNDDSSKVREHAAFSMSQSEIPDRADALIQLGNTDTSAKVRSQAWFWLTQTAAEQSETAIFAALENESSGKVQRQAIFALSQLPQERAIQALMRIIEDREQSRDNRKQALFWLAQNESDQAVEFLETVLSSGQK